MSSDPEHSFVGRGGLKLRHALKEFGVDPRGMRCADFGCNVGGFTDCLLQAGATYVTAIDTGYGTLAWRLRQDARVKVMERTNALHAPAPSSEAEKMDLVVIDMGWTPQGKCVPVAVKWLRNGGRIITLIKPHYEVGKDPEGLLKDGVLEESVAVRIAERVLEDMAGLGARVVASCKSPIIGGSGKSKGNAQGNSEWLALLEPLAGG